MFNNKAVNSNTTIMANGNKGYKDSKDKALFMLMLDFKPRNSYYVTVEDKLSLMESLIDSLPVKDVIAMSWYLGKRMGLRLSPTIAMTRLAISKDYMISELKFAMREVFTRPDFLANSFGYAQYNGVELKRTPAWMKKLFKSQLESYSDITLKKRRMENREIKLSDLIKVLRPNPNKSKASDKDIFKAIIENRCKLDVDVESETTESITATLSNQSIQSEKKIEIIEKNLSNMGMNEIIRNLANIECSESNREIVINKLNNILTREDSLRFINPFDLIITSSLVDAGWGVAFDTLLSEYVVKQVGKLDNTKILFDISGSMSSYCDDGGYIKGLKFLSLLRPCITDTTEIVWFSNRYGVEEKAQKIMKKCKTPNKFYRAMASFIATNNSGYWWGGTKLTTTLTSVLKDDNDTKNLIIISDEFTYDDTTSTNNVRKACGDRSIILYNVDYYGTTAFNLDSNLLKVTGFDGKVVQMIQLIGNFKKFKQYIIDEFDKEMKLKQR